jgi:hypothetical protein
MSDPTPEWPRLAITGIILFLFAFMAITHWSTGLEETLKNLAVMAVGFWLGSSKGAANQTENVSKALDLAAAPSSPQPVTVVNGQDQPVPTEDAK